MLASRLTRRVEIRLDRRDWPLVFTHEVLLECEEITGYRILKGVNFAVIPAKLLRALLYTALKRAGYPGDLYQLNGHITPHNLSYIQEKLQDAWRASMPDPNEEEPETTPTEKSKCKALTWMEAWATARYDLKLSDEEWLELTPRQLEALRERRIQQLQREEFLVGLLASTTANFSMCHPRTPLKAESFMLHKPKPEPLEPVTGETIRAVFGAVSKFPISNPPNE